MTDTDGALRPRRLVQTLRVIAVRDGEIDCAIDRAAGCGACSVRQGCGTRALADLMTARDDTMSFRSNLNVTPGQFVAVSMASPSFLGAAFLAFLLPPTVLIATIGLVKALEMSGLTGGILCLAAFALSFWPLRRAEKRWRMSNALDVEAVVTIPPQRVP